MLNIVLLIHTVYLKQKKVMLKKLFTLILSLSFLASNFHITKAEAYETYFVVTAYYSPLPDQDYYLRWNYAAEIRLNWRWIAWASWKWVFEGMIAAPKSYAFGTQIYLEWVWTWVVHDRWGAIVQAGQRWYAYDRIDIWMWYWDEGLKRALTWGKRTVKWKVMWVNKNAKWNISIANFPTSVNAVASLAPANTIYSLNLWVEDSWEKVKELQEELAKKWIYSWNIDWIYNPTLISELVEFQINNKIVSSVFSYGAGYWGPKTRSTVAKIKNVDIATIAKEEVKNNVTEEEYKENKNELASQNWKITSIFDKYIHKKSSSSDIKDLQTVLSRIWAYDWEIDWIYDSVKEDFINYQLSSEIIYSKNEAWAGYWGPKTRTKVESDLNKLIALEKEVEKTKKEEEEKNRKEKEELALIEKEVDKKLDYIWTPVYGEASDNIRDLQLALKELWYFNYTDTAYFGNVTKNAIILYQLDKWLIDSKTSYDAWFFWDKTKKSLKNDLVTLLKEKDVEYLDFSI